MKNIFLFESFISEIYEAGHTHHSGGRLSLTDPDSRIVPYSINFPFGFKVENIADSKERLYDPDMVEELLNIDSDTMNNYISMSLYFLCNNKKIDDVKSYEQKPFLLVDLGRICFKSLGEKYYPIIAGGRGPDKHGFYNGGDNIWMFTKPYQDKEIGMLVDKITTIKYYEKTSFGLSDMVRHSAVDAGMRTSDFKNVSSYSYPYGQNFEVIIDVTEDEEEDIVIERIKRQINK